MKSRPNMFSRDTAKGAVLGTALGDAIGLPFEGLTPRRVERRLAGKELGHSTVAGRGALSDHTEHTALVACVQAESDGVPQSFQASGVATVKTLTGPSARRFALLLVALIVAHLGLRAIGR